MRKTKYRAVQPFVPLLSWFTARYITRQRRRLWPQAHAMAPDFVQRLQGFFPEEVLRGTRAIRTVVPSPFFYPLVRGLGLGEFPEMSAIGAITFVDLVAYPEPVSIRTMFHELVHVMQYRVLGVRTFAQQYVQGFVNRGGYEGIPLEQQAYRLDARFSRHPGRLFSVEEEVRQFCAADQSR
jgi:hypothetical protein